MCTALRCSVCLCQTQIPSVQRANQEGGGWGVNGRLWCFRLDNHFKGGRASGQPPTKSSLGITIVWKALRALPPVSSKRSADRSSPAALRTPREGGFQPAALDRSCTKKKRRLGRRNLIRRGGKRKFCENASGTDCGAMAHDGTSAARSGGNET